MTNKKRLENIKDYITYIIKSDNAAAKTIVEALRASSHDLAEPISLVTVGICEKFEDDSGRKNNKLIDAIIKDIINKLINLTRVLKLYDNDDDRLYDQSLSRTLQRMDNINKLKKSRQSGNTGKEDRKKTIVIHKQHKSVQ